MARITLAGDAVVVTSALTLEELRKIKKYKGNALTLYGGADGDEPLFRITVDQEVCLGKLGAGFMSETHDEAKKAVMTIVLENVVGDIKEFVADTFGEAITKLNALEATLPAVLVQIDAEKAAIMSQIEIA